MPHVKGNKFKPKVPVDVPAEILDDDGEVVPFTKRENHASLDEDGTDAAAAVPPPSKKGRPAKPVIPTVLAPAPKGTSVTNKAVATSNWESLKAAMQAKASKKPQKNKKRKGGPDSQDALQPASTSGQLTKMLDRKSVV